jgi:organic radical activating enzyme
MNEQNKKIVYCAQLNNTHDFTHTISIDLTHNCNFNCWYCYDKPNRDKHKNIFIDVEHIRSFFNSYSEIFPKGKINVNLLGGEPTLHKELKEICNIILSYKQVKTLRITSNGSASVEKYNELYNSRVIINFSYHENKLYSFEEFLQKCNDIKCTLEISYMLNDNLDIDVFKERKELLKKYICSYIPLSGISYKKDFDTDIHISSFTKYNLMRVRYDDGTTNMILPNEFITKGKNPFIGMKCEAFNEYWKMSPFGKLRVGCEKYNDGYMEFELCDFTKFITSIQYKVCELNVCDCFYHSKKWL